MDQEAGAGRGLVVALDLLLGLLVQLLLLLSLRVYRSSVKDTDSYGSVSFWVVRICILLGFSDPDPYPNTDPGNTKTTEIIKILYALPT